MPRLLDGRSEVRIPEKARGIPIFHYLQKGSRPQPATCLKDTRILSWGKAIGA